MNVKVFTGLGIIGLAVAVLVVLAGVLWCPQTPGRSPSPSSERLPAAPEFVSITEWFNSKPISLSDQRGKVLVVHFWTNGCINCIHNYPHYRAWQERYEDRSDFVMVGVHTPEFDSEKDLGRLRDRLA